MLKPGVSKRSHAATWFFPTLGIAGSIALAWSIGALQGGETERRKSVAYTYHESAKDTARRVCSGSVTQRVYECVAAQYDAADERQRAEQDLTAQQEAAWASIFSAVFAALTLLATGIGLFWVKGTLDATRIGAEAAQGSVDETRRIGEAQIRAYINIDRLIVKYERQMADVTISVTNSGASPARNVQMDFNHVFETGDFEGNPVIVGDKACPVIDSASYKDTISSGANRDIQSAKPIYPYPDISQPPWNARWGVVIRVFVTLRWVDVFGKSYSLHQQWLALSNFANHHTPIQLGLIAEVLQDPT
ncbi:MAG: hypothetical protein V4595_09090 [Pseudomonadota bacterium]